MVISFSMNKFPSIRIPLQDKSGFFEVFPDELPEDFNDIVDVLKAVFAPLSTWSSSAVSHI